jgi:hypothetical protein
VWYIGARGIPGSIKVHSPRAAKYWENLASDVTYIWLNWGRTRNGGGGAGAGVTLDRRNMRIRKADDDGLFSRGGGIAVTGYVGPLGGLQRGGD